MNSPPILPTDREKIVLNLPQPTTAISSNHFAEHLIRIESIKQMLITSNNSSLPLKFGDKPLFSPKILIYDLGLIPEQVRYLQENSHLYIYKKFDFSKYPEHVKNLYTYSWKIIIWNEVLASFGHIFWFDSSINFKPNRDRKSVLKILSKYFLSPKNPTDFLYYVHQAAHNVSYSTHYSMFGYFPTELETFFFLRKMFI